ncbi:glycerophosphodiester phosphodiesterase [Thalassobellus suaedae]|uniref:Glycerophosphodiester phosphodiesterase family protein n=1 Tax=Thalassobellus suaedae TaxID=3074124 RepID=A0ABY9Y6K8_9FLAO|nr:glycerophosphodiester phosphodiesterase family protein [Flavobacteriaceae bacterium HL-DH10]
MEKPCLRIGHRGAMGHLAENTMASIKKALEFGVDGIEIDVHKCASGELVVFHDFTLDRMTQASGEISKYTLSELKTFQVNGQFDIPTLEEVVTFIDRKCLLNIELKGRNTALETERIIKKHIDYHGWMYGDFIVSSFQHHELEHIFSLNSQVPLAVLTKANVDEAIGFAKTINAHAIHPNIAIVTRNNVKEAKDMGYKVNVWTANNKDTIVRMKDYNVDAIISDFPDRI